MNEQPVNKMKPGIRRCDIAASTAFCLDGQWYEFHGQAMRYLHNLLHNGHNHREAITKMRKEGYIFELPTAPSTIINIRTKEA